jgi:serine/threonine-protein kinase
MTEPVQQMATGWPDRYAVERELGRGGTAIVLLARDLKLGRPVALKVLRPEVGSVVGIERFLREIRLAAQLQHPHILPLFDSGAINGCPYYSMPYVGGESLRARLLREPQLPLDEALQIAGEVADALVYAHSQGVIHRDIKPENILLESGPTGTRALVADFGIAQALTVAGGERLTETGLAIGTPAYMSPEQATGSGRLDARSDVYSLGCVLYEMLAGNPPFMGPTVQAIQARHAVDPVPSLRTVRPTLPKGIEQVVTKALAKVPADRYASAAEFIQALAAPGPAADAATHRRRRLAGAALTLGLGFVIGLGALLAWRRSRDVAEPPLKRIAVLPFENLGDSADDYLADGVTEAVRGKLTSVARLQVLASTSSNQYRRTTKSVRQIGRELGADYLLVGTVRWLKGPGRGNRIQVSPELVEVSSSADKWQQPFDAALTDVFKVQADIASQVSQALGVALSSAARVALAGRPTQNLAAYEALLRGDRLLITEGRLDGAAVRQATAAYGDAVRLDSTFGLAWARLAWASTYSPARDSLSAFIKEAADRALILAPDLGQTWDAVAMVRSALYRDQEGAISALERGRALAPHDVDILSQLAIQLRDVGRLDEAVALCMEAARLDPRSPMMGRRCAGTLVWARRFKAADSIGTPPLDVAPGHFPLLFHVVEARLALGDVTGARAALRAALRQVSGQQLVTAPFPQDFVWLLDDSLRALALRLPPEAFDKDTAGGLWRIAEINWDLGRYAAARAIVDSLRPLLERRVEEHPADDELHSLLALAQASAGRCQEAAREAERAGALRKPAPNTISLHSMVALRMGVALRCGDHAGAVARADTLVHIAGPYTRARLKVDPYFAPLRGRADFERLVAGN